MYVCCLSLEARSHLNCHWACVVDLDTLKYKHGLKHITDWFCLEHSIIGSSVNQNRGDLTVDQNCSMSEYRCTTASKKNVSVRLKHFLLDQCVRSRHIFNVPPVYVNKWMVVGYISFPIWKVNLFSRREQKWCSGKRI